MLKIHAVNTPDDDGVVWGGFKMTGILNGCAYSWELNLHFIIYGNYVLLFRNSIVVFVILVRCFIITTQFNDAVYLC